LCVNGSVKYKGRYDMMPSWLGLASTPFLRVQVYGGWYIYAWQGDGEQMLKQKGMLTDYM
jgi:hypothetical protein